uniref:Uncharacterized protein n=1 Tax=Cannabis sativa TaxID=3483 RepID=A0A803R8S8_CANSA
MRKKNFKWNCTIKNRGWHAINKKACRGNCIGPKRFRDFHLKQESTCSFKKMSVFTFCNTILRCRINTRSFMKHAIRGHIRLKLSRHVLFGIITSQSTNRYIKLSLNLSTKSTRI